jgi:hypothetical protein
MKLYVLLPNADGAPPELDLAMECSDRDALRKLANDLANEIHKSRDFALEWRAASGGDEELLVQGHCSFLIQT